MDQFYVNFEKISYTIQVMARSSAARRISKDQILTDHTALLTEA